MVGVRARSAPRPIVTDRAVYIQIGSRGTVARQSVGPSAPVAPLRRTTRRSGPSRRKDPTRGSRHDDRARARRPTGDGPAPFEPRSQRRPPRRFRCRALPAYRSGWPRRRRRLRRPPCRGVGGGGSLVASRRRVIYLFFWIIENQTFIDLYRLNIMVSELLITDLMPVSLFVAYQVSVP